VTAGARRTLARYAALSAGLNFVWEIVQLPLYTIFQTGTPSLIAFAVAHCTAGDVLITLASYGIASLLTWNGRWIVDRPLAGGMAAIPAGVIYTAFSEWLNVSVRGSWAYADAMPTVGGIGLWPLLQWMIVPMLVICLTRRSA
jgi:hypothetical protein